MTCEKLLRRRREDEIRESARTRARIHGSGEPVVRADGELLRDTASIRAPATSRIACGALVPPGGAHAPAASELGKNSSSPLIL
jgi:hypothetical protein